MWLHSSKHCPRKVIETTQSKSPIQCVNRTGRGKAQAAASKGGGKELSGVGVRHNKGHGAAKSTNVGKGYDWPVVGVDTQWDQGYCR